MMLTHIQLQQIKLKIMQSTDNNINSNKPWNLSDHPIHNSQLNFFVKLVHVDRYHQVKKHNRSDNKKSNSTSVNKYHQNIKPKTTKTTTIMNQIMPQKLVRSVSIWNDRKQYNRSVDIGRNNNRLQTTVIDSPFRSKHSKLKVKLNQMELQSTRRHKFHTQYIDSSRVRSQMPINKTFSIANQNMDNVLKTEGDQNQVGMYRNTSVIQKKSSKKQTIKELVEYRKENTQRKKNYFINKFKTILNKAKFSDMLHNAKSS